MEEYFTEALVLDKEPIGESDSLISLYTKELGKITARAISIRKITSKLSSHLEPLNFVDARLVHKNRFQVVDALKTGRLNSKAIGTLHLIKDLSGEGEPDRDLWNLLKKGNFEGDEELEVGMQLRVETDNGIAIASIAKIVGEDITLDLNHPLAGETLHFDVEIIDVRDATTEEIEHGHVHGPGGHHH